jgi:hypothetical protein
VNTELIHAGPNFVALVEKPSNVALRVSRTLEGGVMVWVDPVEGSSTFFEIEGDEAIQALKEFVKQL